MYVSFAIPMKTRCNRLCSHSFGDYIFFKIIPTNFISIIDFCVIGVYNNNKQGH